MPLETNDTIEELLKSYLTWIYFLYYEYALKNPSVIIRN